MEDTTMDFYELGLGDFFMLSAQNNRSVGDMLDGVIKKLPEKDFKDNNLELDIDQLYPGGIFFEYVCLFSVNPIYSPQ